MFFFLASLLNFWIRHRLRLKIMRGPCDHAEWMFLSIFGQALFIDMFLKHVFHGPGITSNGRCCVTSEIYHISLAEKKTRLKSTTFLNQKINHGRNKVLSTQKASMHVMSRFTESERWNKLLTNIIFYVSSLISILLLSKTLGISIVLPDTWICDTWICAYF